MKRFALIILALLVGFGHPMWDNEAERIGKQKCTPIGYAIHVFGELIGFLGLLLLLATPVGLGVMGVAGTFHASLCWLLLVPFGFCAVGQVLHQFSWWLALRKGFHYDHDLSEASWMESGQRRTYKYSR